MVNITLVVFIAKEMPEGPLFKVLALNAQDLIAVTIGPSF